MAFISYRHGLNKVLAGVARGEKGSKGRGSKVRLSNTDTPSDTCLHFVQSRSIADESHSVG